MPDTVKPFFDGIDSTIKKFQEADRIHQFQTSQIEMYLKRNMDYKKKYYKVKAETAKMHKLDQDFTKSMKEEYLFMEKLKNAYR
jgi:hypothetical protein